MSRHQTVIYLYILSQLIISFFVHGIQQMWIYSLGVTLQQSIACCSVQRNDKLPSVVVDQRSVLLRTNHNANSTPTTASHNNHQTKAPDFLRATSMPPSAVSNLPTATITHDPLQHVRRHHLDHQHRSDAPSTNISNTTSTTIRNGNKVAVAAYGATTASLDTVIATMCHAQRQRRGSLMYLLNVSNVRSSLSSAIVFCYTQRM